MTKFALTLLVAILVPTMSLANGGDQRVVDNTYLINLSRAPFTPQVGVKTSFLASFFDLSENTLVSENIIADVRIARLGGPDKREFIFEKKDIAVTGGVFDFSHTFQNKGLHEIFFDFRLASNPEKNFGAPDFLIDVVDAPAVSDARRDARFSAMGAVAGAMTAAIVMAIARRRKTLPR